MKIEKIGLQTFGSEGDINPFLILADALCNAGYNVTLNITGYDETSYKKYEKEPGITINQHVKFDLEKFNKMRQDVLTAPLAKQGAIVMDYYLYSNFEILYKTAKELCRTNDLVIGHCLSFPLAFAVEKTQTPHITLFPTAGFIASDNYAPMGLPNLGKTVNKLLWSAVSAGMNQFFNKQINSYRKQIGLPKIRSFLNEIAFSKRLNIVTFSPALINYKNKNLKNIHFTGFFTKKSTNNNEKLSPELNDFLAQKGPTCFITFGSMNNVDPDPKTTINLLIKALKLAKIKGIIQYNWTNYPDTKKDRDIYYPLTRIDHQTILSHTDLVIHHAGAGTAQATVLAGCPSIVVSHGADQTFNGRILQNRGVCPKVFKRANLTPEKLARSIKEILENKEYKKRAEKLSQRIKQEKGVTEAVKLIQKI